MNIIIKPQHMTVSAQSVTATVSTGDQIVKEYIDCPTYEGEYTVTPSDSVQTLETADLKMAQDVTVNAIPSDYVGGDVPRRSSSDLSASGATVSVPSGYYADAASKTVQSGSVSVPRSTINCLPSISVLDTGWIQASVSESKSVSPSVTEGYVTSGSSGLISATGTNVKRIDIQSAETITPTESEQTAVATHTWTTGEVKVGAIPSDYVGSSVPQKSSSDLTVSGATVTAPSGYYAESASASVPNGSLGNTTVVISSEPTEMKYLVKHEDATSGYYPSSSLTTVGTVILTKEDKTVTPSETEQTVTPTNNARYLSSVAVDAIPSNYVGSAVPVLGATTYTPSNVAQEISADQYLTGAQTISAVAPPYYDMSGSLAWLGAGAELVTTINLADVKLSATDFATWTPSTTAQDILATRTAGTFSATDMDENDYYICWETVIPIEYQSGAVNKARPLYLAAFHVQTIIRRSSSMANILADVANSNINASAFTGGNFLRYYGSTQGTITYTWSTSYGFYGSVTANTLSSTTSNSPTITLKTPKVTARCSTTYMSTANAALIDQTNTVIKQKCTVYRVKKSNYFEGCFNSVMRMVQGLET